MQELRYAWVVVWSTFFSLAVIFGVSYSFAAFFESFATEFSAQRADVALIFGLSGLVYFVLGAVGGMLSDRFGPRVVCSMGMCCIALGLLGTSFAQSMATVYLCYGACVGLGIALVYTPSIGCVQPWFTRRRGLAAGLASAGIGAGTLVVPLLMGITLDSWAWREAMQLLAVGVLLVGLVAAGLLRRAPAAMAQGAVPVSGLSLREALRTRSFRWLYASVVLGAPTMFIPFAHVSAAARDLGMDDARAVGLVGLIGVGSLVGRFGIGALADRIGRPLTLVLMQASMGLSYVVWHSAQGYAAWVVFALWFGLSYGGIVSLLPALCMDLFGARSVSSIIGTLYTGAAFGNLLGPVVAGAVFDHVQSYGWVIGGCLVLSTVATLVSLPLHRHRQDRF
jgi:MFS family permease